MEPTLNSPLPAPAAAPWPRDGEGRLLPLVPVPGLVLERGGPGLVYDRVRVLRADGRRFCLSGDPTGHERPLSSWGSYLDGVFATPGAVLRVHLPGCRLAARSRCRGCDGSAVGRPELAQHSGRTAAAPAASTPTHGATMPAVPLAQRDARLLRAARDVLNRYRFIELAPGQLRVEGGTRDYEVQLSLDGESAPRCTCPDNRRPEVGGFCKHAIAVLIRDPAQHYQLLELFL
jgi:hypothetical protein